MGMSLGGFCCRVNLIESFFKQEYLFNNQSQKNLNVRFKQLTNKKTCR